MISETALARVSLATARVLPVNLALEFRVLVIEANADEIVLASASPLTTAAVNRIERATGLRPRVVLVEPHRLSPELARCYGTVELPTAQEEPTAIALAEGLLRRALLERATDLHIEQQEQGLIARMRIDGVLRVADTIEPHLAPRVLSRLKLIAGMDIAERRLPQDGRIDFSFEGRLIDIRVASLPTNSGERLALRFLDAHGTVLRFAELGMPDEIADALHAILSKASGLVLTCGPTGSGKTTTLYAALEALDRTARHICTVEDPIERRLDGVSQVAINTRSGLTFAVALRAILRQDPDVVMIGEVRDEETATTAVNAALSGQLVVASVHSPHVIGAIERMRELGVRPSSLAAVTSAILAQRLVRRLCVMCRKNSSTQAEAAGCEHCAYSGFYGRAPLYDLRTMETPLRRALLGSGTLDGLIEESPLLRATIDRYQREGVTTAAELARVASLWTMGNG